MNYRGVVGILLLVSLSVFAQLKTKITAAKPAISARSTQTGVIPDLPRRVERFRQVRMPLPEGLSSRERKLISVLVDASRYLENIYWRQVDPEGLFLYQSLRASPRPADRMLRRLLWISGSRFDLTDNNVPFVVGAQGAPGGGFYPPGLSRSDIESYVREHPEKRAEIYSPTTIVRWHGNDLEGLPYHIAFRGFLEPAAKDLRDAAALTPEPDFARYLRLRAEALLTDDYMASDLAWLELKRPKIDVIFAPYESYSDGLLGVKTTFGAAVLIRNAAESQRVEGFQKYVASIHDALPTRFEASETGRETPLEIMDSPFRAGDLAHGYQAVADNLPNDPRVHEEKGSKKVFFKNFMDARVNYTILPLARRLMPADDAAKVSSEGYLLGTLMHEIAHGFGPTFVRNQRGEKINLREQMGPIFAGLEEAKADVVGMFALEWLVAHAALPKQKLPEYYASYVAGNLRTIRFGAAEAHGQAEMMEFNYYLEHGGVCRLASGKYAVDYQKLPGQIEKLAKELLEMEATGDRTRAEDWFKHYDVLSLQAQKSLDSVTNVPIDIDPIFSFPQRVH
ncbi:MAG: Zn-dependent hydrolase [Acidobacteria bacterium]|nr:Zn-dependent hydrolase [Acidobacteriota bacterium]